MRYPTEAKHGTGGYRRTAGRSVAVPVSPRPVVSPRPPLPVPANSNVFTGVAANLNTIRSVFRPANPPYNVIREDLQPGWYMDAQGNIGLAVGVPEGGRFVGDFDPEHPLAPPIGPYVTAPGQAGETTDPSQWASADWTWFPCTIGAPTGSPPIKFMILNSGNLFCDSAGGVHPQLMDGSVHDTPAAAAAARTTEAPYITAYLDNPQPAPGPDPWIRMLGDYVWTSGTSYAPWTGPAAQPAIVTMPEGYPHVLPNPGGASYPETLPSPQEQPALAPEVGPREAPVTTPMPYLPPWVPAVILPPAVSPSPGSPPVPVQPPTVIVQPGTGGNPDVEVVPGSPGRTPPGPNRRDRKGDERGVSRGGGAVRAVVNGYTEMMDFINALYAGVPQELRKTNCHPYDMYCQLSTLWDVWDDPAYDPAEFVEAFINNQFEDMFFGQIGNLLKQASVNLDILTGLNRAINAGPQAAQDYMDEQGIEGVDLLPELVHDPATGAWSLTWDLFGASIPISAGSPPPRG